MSRAIQASCAAGVVKVNALPIAGATILSQGVKASTGLLHLESDKATYVTSNASDIHDLISSVCAIIDKITLIVTALDAESVSPGGQTANITAMGLLKTTLLATKDTLK